METNKKMTQKEKIKELIFLVMAQEEKIEELIFREIQNEKNNKMTQEEKIKETDVYECPNCVLEVDELEDNDYLEDQWNFQIKNERGHYYSYSFEEHFECPRCGQKFYVISEEQQ